MKIKSATRLIIYLVISIILFGCRGNQHRCTELYIISPKSKYSLEASSTYYDGPGSVYYRLTLSDTEWSSDEITIFDDLPLSWSKKFGSIQAMWVGERVVHVYCVESFEKPSQFSKTVSIKNEELTVKVFIDNAPNLMKRMANDRKLNSCLDYSAWTKQ